MRKQVLLASLVIILSHLAHATAPPSASVIYGDDDRRDYFEINDLAWRGRADSTVALIRASSLNVNGTVTEIQTESYGSSMGLCTNEPFYDQETAAFCSGFLVTPDTIVTAGHCVRNSQACASTRFVFGFRLGTASDRPRSVPSDQVYQCARLVHSVVQGNGEDFAVVKLDRPVSQFKPLSFRTTGRPQSGDPLAVIGHPAGLPLKLAGGARIRSVNNEYLVANLDTYGGNSGSAVFNQDTGEVEGVLVRGEMDFVYKNGCRISNRCDSNGCRGEDVTLFERVMPYLGL